MTTGPAGHGHQAVRAGSSGFAAESFVHHIGENDAAVIVDDVDRRGRAAKRGDDDRWLVLGHQRKVVGQSRVR